VYTVFCAVMLDWIRYIVCSKDLIRCVPWTLAVMTGKELSHLASSVVLYVTTWWVRSSCLCKCCSGTVLYMILRSCLILKWGKSSAPGWAAVGSRLHSGLWRPDFAFISRTCYVDIVCVYLLKSWPWLFSWYFLPETIFLSFGTWKGGKSQAEQMCWVMMLWVYRCL
jgi:hypothetical protein